MLLQCALIIAAGKVKDQHTKNTRCGNSVTLSSRAGFPAVNSCFARLRSASRQPAAERMLTAPLPSRKLPRSANSEARHQRYVQWLRDSPKNRHWNLAHQRASHRLADRIIPAGIFLTTSPQHYHWRSCNRFRSHSSLSSAGPRACQRRIWALGRVCIS